MDIGVKERVIGAVVLVVLGIIIIPWVLQGPAPESSVTRNVPLPAASTTAAPQEYRMDLSGQASQPVQPAMNPAQPTPSAAVANPPAAQAVRHKAPPSTPTTAPQSQPIERAAAASSTVSGGWMVQAGSYGSEHNALKLQQTLAQRGYHVLISRYSTGSTTYYRVRVGPYAERAAAEKAVPAINHIYGGKAKVVPNS
ncbi:MAG: SPOR domain-containing protein [Gammaproteobacteria bacterium]